MLRKIFGSDPPDRLTKQEYRNLFDNPAGKTVLADMLRDLKFFDAVANADDVALQNYARKLLWKTGVWQDINGPDIVDAFFKIPEKGE